VTGQQPEIDLESMPAPAEGILVTHFLIVRNVARSRAFYADVLGGQVVLEENPCIVKLANSWIIMNPGGGTTPDKPVGSGRAQRVQRGAPVALHAGQPAPERV
jgi:catechol 2,3-dioxygenase-like lactoylglutathione lyase family enzyme